MSVVNFFIYPCIRWDVAVLVGKQLCWFQCDITNGDVGWSVFLSGKSWWRASVFLRLMSAPNIREVSTNRNVISCNVCSEWAIREEKSAKRRSLFALSMVKVWAYMRHRSKRLLSIRYRNYTKSSSSRSSVTCLNIILKKDDRESQNKDKTLPHTVSDGNGFRQISIESDLAVMFLVQLEHRLHKMCGTAKSFPDKPYSCLAHSVNKLC